MKPKQREDESLKDDEDIFNRSVDQQQLNQLDKWKHNIELQQATSLISNHRNQQMNVHTTSFNNQSFQQKYEHLLSLRDDYQEPEINIDILDMVMKQELHDENQNIIIPFQDDIYSKKKFTQYEMHDEVQEFNNDVSSNYNCATSECYSIRDRMSSKSTQSSDNSKNTSSTSIKDINYKSSQKFIELQLNKQLLNKLLLQRVSKTYNKQNDSIQNNESDLIKVREIFSKETESFAQKTLPSFKNVGNQFQRLGSVIQYDELLSDILSSLNTPLGVLKSIMTDKKKQQRPMNSQSCHMSNHHKSDLNSDNFQSIEAAFKQNFMLCNSQVKSSYDNLVEERIIQTQIQEELRKEKSILQDSLNRIQKQEDSYFRNQLLHSQKSKKILAHQLKMFQKKEESNLLDELQQERECLIDRYDSIQLHLTQSLKQQENKISLIKEQLNKRKTLRNEAKLLLKEYYVHVIKENIMNGKYSQQINLIQIVKQLLSINNQDAADYTFIYPSYLDQQSIQFIQSWANILVKIDQLNSQISSNKPHQQLQKSLSIKQQLENSKQALKEKKSQTISSEEESKQNEMNSQQREGEFASSKQNQSMKSINSSPNQYFNHLSLNFHSNCEKVKSKIHRMARRSVIVQKPKEQLFDSFENDEIAQALPLEQYNNIKDKNKISKNSSIFKECQYSTNTTQQQLSKEEDQSVDSSPIAIHCKGQLREYFEFSDKNLQLREQLKSCSAQIEDLKKKEVQRLLSNYTKKKLSPQLLELQLISLFGIEETNVYLQQYFKELNDQTQKLSSSQFFKFSNQVLPIKSHRSFQNKPQQFHIHFSHSTLTKQESYNFSEQLSKMKGEVHLSKDCKEQKKFPVKLQLSDQIMKQFQIKKSNISSSQSSFLNLSSKNTMEETFFISKNNKKQLLPNNFIK